MPANQKIKNQLAGTGLLLTVIGLTIASGIAVRAGGKPGSDADFPAIAERMASFPNTIGDWRQISAPAMAPEALRELQCEGHIDRVYENPASGRVAHALMLLGPPGTISAHTPEVCYSSKDYEILGEPRSVEMTVESGAKHRFWLVRVRRRDAAQQVLHVYYAWSTDSTWRASATPRLEFTFSPQLYKCQVVFEENTESGDDEERDFLRELAQTATRTVFTDPAKTAR